MGTAGSLYFSGTERESIHSSRVKSTTREYQLTVDWLKYASYAAVSPHGIENWQDFSQFDA